MLKRAWELRDAIRKFLSLPDIRKEYATLMMAEEDRSLYAETCRTIPTKHRDGRSSVS